MLPIIVIVIVVILLAVVIFAARRARKSRDEGSARPGGAFRSNPVYDHSAPTSASEFANLHVAYVYCVCVFVCVCVCVCVCGGGAEGVVTVMAVGWW